MKKERAVPKGKKPLKPRFPSNETLTEEELADYRERQALAHCAEIAKARRERLLLLKEIPNKKRKRRPRYFARCKDCKAYKLIVKHKDNV